MPNRTIPDEREKFDHSGHPLHSTTPADLRSPGGGDPAQSRERGDKRGGVSQPEPVTPIDPAEDSRAP